MTITKFHDAHVRPPRGGWQIVIGNQPFDGYSENQVFERVKKWRIDNGTFVSDQDIQREMWTEYCRRQPERCGATAAEVKQVHASQIIPRELTKEFVGPIIWKFLNIAAATWTKETNHNFGGLCGMISTMLDCPVCKQEWQEIVRSVKDPNEQFSSRYRVCQWVNAVHNRVNARVGKALYPYSDMVREYGAPAYEQ